MWYINYKSTTTTAISFYKYGRNMCVCAHTHESFMIGADIKHMFMCVLHSIAKQSSVLFVMIYDSDKH